MNAVEVKGLTKQFGKRLALSDLSFSVKKGDMYAILGVNGAGKTTAIKILTGIMPPTSGEGTVMGAPLNKLNSAKPRMNISTQENAVSSGLTAKENLKFMCRIYGLNKKETKICTDKLITEFDMHEFENRRAKYLSGGELRRLSIAMSLVNTPEILFLDEPTIGIDVLSRRSLHRSIKALHKKTTVILTTHYIEEAETLADRVLIMSNGKGIAEGSPSGLIKVTGTASLEEAFISLAENNERGGAL